MYIGFYNFAMNDYFIKELSEVIDTNRHLHIVYKSEESYIPICMGETIEDVQKQISDIEAEQIKALGEFEHMLTDVISILMDKDDCVEIEEGETVKDDGITVFFDEKEGVYPVVSVEYLYREFLDTANEGLEFEDAVYGFCQDVIVMFSDLWKEKPSCPHCHE